MAILRQFANLLIVVLKTLVTAQERMTYHHVSHARSSFAVVVCSLQLALEHRCDHVPAPRRASLRAVEGRRQRESAATAARAPAAAFTTAGESEGEGDVEPATPAAAIHFVVGIFSFAAFVFATQCSHFFIVDRCSRSKGHRADEICKCAKGIERLSGLKRCGSGSRRSSLFL